MFSLLPAGGEGKFVNFFETGDELFEVMSRMEDELKTGNLSRAAGGQQVENFAQSLPDVLNLGAGLSWEGDCRLRLISLDLCPQLLAGAGDGETLLVEKLLDAQNAFDVALAVHTLAGAALNRLQLRKLGFPETEDVGRQVAEAGYFADPEIELVGDENFIRFVLRRAFFVRCHFSVCATKAASSAYCDTGHAEAIKEFRARKVRSTFKEAQGQANCAVPKIFNCNP